MLIYLPASVSSSDRHAVVNNASLIMVPCPAGNMLIIFSMLCGPSVSCAQKKQMLLPQLDSQRDPTYKMK